MAAASGLPAKIRLQIVSAERSLVDELVDEVEIPGWDGYFGVWPGHTPLLAALSVGTLSYRQGPERRLLVLAFGFAEVQPDRVTILAQIAERPEEIDFERARAARTRAEERIATPTADIDVERARIAMLKALVRLQAAERARMRS
ncbi:MAG: F0F1 ATP synthase subunit epsilon [Acidobacteria bacterium]|nr:F0F1 ATP synthase subunit epsilon [Acidobacteriota bacterium]